MELKNNPDNFWPGKSVLITGSSGFIGRHLCSRLKALKAKVFEFDNSLGPRYDVTMIEGIDSELRMSKHNVIIHLAANSGVEASRYDAYEAHNLNILGTLNILQAALQVKPSMPVVIASSNHIYGDHGGAPTTEDAALRRLDTYSASKICADYLARSYAHDAKLPVTIMRNTNCYGPDDPHLDHIIPSTIKSLQRNFSPILRSSGLTRKSYLHVSDVVDAYLLATQYQMENETICGEVFNVSGTSISAIDLVNLIREYLDKPDVEIKFKEDPDFHMGQVDENLDSSKIRALGWRPKHTLYTGIMETAQWMKENKAVEVMSRTLPGYNKTG